MLLCLNTIIVKIYTPGEVPPFIDSPGLPERMVLMIRWPKEVNISMGVLEAFWANVLNRIFQLFIGRHLHMNEEKNQDTKWPVQEWLS